MNINVHVLNNNMLTTRFIRRRVNKSSFLSHTAHYMAVAELKHWYFNSSTRMLRSHFFIIFNSFLLQTKSRDPF
jgi:hypothetical protein